MKFRTEKTTRDLEAGGEGGGRVAGGGGRVYIQDAVSDQLPLKYGVPLGSILGPVLFTIYVNDLLSVPEHCKSACNVDDNRLYLFFPSSYISTAIDNLNEGLERISGWCCKILC